MPDEAPVTSATGFLRFIGLPSKRGSVIIVHSSYDEHHILMQKNTDTTGVGRLREPLHNPVRGAGGRGYGAYTRGQSETRHGDVCLPEPAPRLRVPPPWRPRVSSALRPDLQLHDHL